MRLDKSVRRTLERSGEASATFAMRSDKEVCVLLEPAEGAELVDLLAVAEQLRRSPSWDNQRFTLVTRVFMARNAHIWIAREAGGSLTVKGSAQDVTRALSGQISVGLTWTGTNLYEKAFEGPGVFGVHLARIPKKGPVKVL